VSSDARSALALELLRSAVTGASLFEFGLRARQVGFLRGALEGFLGSLLGSQCRGFVELLAA
jgi:hypothetical protein